MTTDDKIEKDLSGIKETLKDIDRQFRTLNNHLFELKKLLIGGTANENQNKSSEFDEAWNACPNSHTEQTDT